MPITAENPFKGRQHPGAVIVLCVRRYLRYPLSYEDVAERGVPVDASCIWRWVQAYAPELNKRCRIHLRPTNKSYRIDETYIKVKREDKYLYRALDSAGQTIDFLLSAKRDTAAAKRFLRKAIEASGNPMPRVINVDKNPAYPAAMAELKAEGAVPRLTALRQCKYLNNVIEQDHRTVKKRVWLAKRLWLVLECMADGARHRSSEHGPEGPSEMVGQRRRVRGRALHRRTVRPHSLMTIPEQAVSLA